jgi:multicomponent K+:H+ antiporter subunit E
MTIRNRWLPHPALSVLLLLVWLLLFNTASAGQILLGTFIAVGVPLLNRRFWPEAPKVGHWLRLSQFVVTVLVDIVIANIAVARLVLGSNSRLHPAVVRVPLDLDDPFAVTLLASTVSLTPGTVSAEISEDRHLLEVHCLDLEDAEALVRTIKDRYEAPLKEIFSC